MENEENDDKEVINVVSYNQSGGITANNVTFGHIIRRMNYEAEMKIKNLLHGNVHVQVYCLSGVSDGPQLTDQIISWLRRENYNFELMSYNCFFPENIRGVVVRPDKKDGSISQIIIGPE